MSARALTVAISQIVVEAVSNAMSNNEELIDLLRQEGVDLEDAEAVQRFLQRLTLIIENDGDTLNMINANLDRYKSLVRQALEDEQVIFDPSDFGPEGDY